MAKSPWLILLLLMAVNLAQAQTEGASAGFSPDPMSTELVTSDIPLFWRAYDRAQQAQTRTEKIRIYQEEYLGNGTVGLADMTKKRIQSAEYLLEAIEKYPQFYASIRPQTLRVAEMESRIRAVLASMKDIYPEAQFLPVYFLIGRLSSGGTITDGGLLIGVEFFCASPETVTDELAPEIKGSIAAMEKIPGIVAHELVHFQQHWFKPTTQPPLLPASVIEGSADFVSELALKNIGKAIEPPERVAYGLAHEKALWEQFKNDMFKTKYKDWLYNYFSVEDRPPDLGYFIGYQICRFYYEQQEDKRQAVHDILNIQDLFKFVLDSGYDASFYGPKEIAVDPAVLKQYAGAYELAAGFDLTVTCEGDRLFVQATGQPKVRLYPKAEHDFFMRDIDAQIRFEKDGDGRVPRLIFRKDGHEQTAKRRE